MSRLGFLRQLHQLRSHVRHAATRLEDQDVVARRALEDVEQRIIEETDVLWRAMSDEERAVAASVARRASLAGGGWADLPVRDEPDPDPDPDEDTDGYSDHPIEDRREPDSEEVSDRTPTTWPPPPDTLVPDSEGVVGAAQASVAEALSAPALCGASKAPPGWLCTRLAGHDGPCAAVFDPVLATPAPPVHHPDGLGAEEALDPGTLQQDIEIERWRHRK